MYTSKNNTILNKDTNTMARMAFEQEMTDTTNTENFIKRDLKIVVYGKRPTSDTLFAIKTISLDQLHIGFIQNNENYV